MNDNLNRRIESFQRLARVIESHAADKSATSRDFVDACIHQLVDEEGSYESIARQECPNDGHLAEDVRRKLVDLMWLPSDSEAFRNATRVFRLALTYAMQAHRADTNNKQSA